MIRTRGLPASIRRLLPLLLLLLTTGPVAGEQGAPFARRGLPNVLVVTVDTLRADRVSAYGCERPTTPNLDRLIAGGVRFTRARTVEPLTGPALASMLTSLYPHEHGASRNGLRMRTGLASLPKTLQAFGYSTAAFVGNWTLRDKLSGLAEHFEVYEEVLTRRRWFGMVRREATADDITQSAGDWIEARLEDRGGPFLVWVHYVEPHAPYRLHDEYVERLGLPTKGDYTREQRYDTEVAFVDHSIGLLLQRLERLGLDGEMLVVFASDHGESLGEHNYWGHGRHLYEPTLRIPMSLTWRGRLAPGTIDAPALILDIAPTVLGLLGLGTPADLQGYDWTAVIDGAPPPTDRVTHYQAHRGAVLSKHDSDLARRSGLLEVGVIHDEQKEIFRVQANRRERYDLAADPQERSDLAEAKSPPSEGVLAWMRRVTEGLSAFDDAPPEPLDEESVEQLRSLGYVD